MEGAEVVVIAKRSPEFQEALIPNGPTSTSSTRERLSSTDERKRQYEGICW